MNALWQATVSAEQTIWREVKALSERFGSRLCPKPEKPSSFSMPDRPDFVKTGSRLRLGHAKGSPTRVGPCYHSRLRRKRNKKAPYFPAWACVSFHAGIAVPPAAYSKLAIETQLCSFRIAAHACAAARPKPNVKTLVISCSESCGGVPGSLLHIEKWNSLGCASENLEKTFARRDINSQRSSASNSPS